MCCRRGWFFRIRFGAWLGSCPLPSAATQGGGALRTRHPAPSHRPRMGRDGDKRSPRRSTVLRVSGGAVLPHVSLPEAPQLSIPLHPALRSLTPEQRRVAKSHSLAYDDVWRLYVGLHLRDTGFALRICHPHREHWIKARRLVARAGVGECAAGLRVAAAQDGPRGIFRAGGGVVGQQAVTICFYRALSSLWICSSNQSM